MLSLFLGYRSALIRAGIAESDLPLTPELRAAAARAQVEARVDDAAKSETVTQVNAMQDDDEDLEELEDGPEAEGDLT